MKGFLDTFYNMDTLRGTLVSDQAWQAMLATWPSPPQPPRRWPASAPGRPTSATTCPSIDHPVLVLHGDADQVLPIDKTSKRLPGLIKDMHLTVIEGGPHAIPWTHAGQVNTALLDFLRRGDAMAEKKALVVYAAVYETVEAALADLDTIEQLHKDELIGQYDAAVIDQENGKPHVVKGMDRPHIRVIPEWFGAERCPARSSVRRLRNSRRARPGSSRSGEPTIEKGLDKAFTGAANVVKRAVDATTGEITSELQEALKDA